MKRVLSISAILLMAGISLNAKITLPNVIGDNMVLQQQTNASIWGKADPDKTVIITPSWCKDNFAVKADKNGDWITKIATPKAGGPYEIKISDGEALTIKNVLIGEVWFCSGQSNMEMPIKGFTSQPTIGGMDAIVNAKACTPIRICHVARCSSPKIKDEVNCKWEENKPEAVSNTSAAAYFFARTIQSATGLPVGIIESDWGGSSIETWIPREVLEKEFKGEFTYKHLEQAEAPKERANQLPSLLYNGQVDALVPYTFKGMIWYQGETNRGKPEQYTRLQTCYVNTMRKIFQCPDAGFYFVQIAPFPYDNKDEFQSGYFVEAQAATLKTIKHSGMATTVDVGEYGTIHPCLKEPVGKRLAYLALKNDYGMDFIDANPPIYESVKFEKGQAIVSFGDVPSCLAPLGTDLPGFEIAGADKVFYPAKARVENRNYVKVSSDKVSDPVAVRYCFRNFQEGKLTNGYGIPASPFRTDNWNDLKK